MVSDRAAKAFTQDAPAQPALFKGVTPEDAESERAPLNGAAAEDVGDERTPLLASKVEASGSSNMGQILILCMARLLEPIAFFACFTFVNQMISDLHEVDEKDIGFVSGIVESIFSATQVVCMLGWGIFSDKFGRKPALIISMLGVGLSVALFGFATRIWQLITLRALAGIFSGSIVTIRTALAEVSNEQTQAQAFGYLAFVSNVGIFIGPLVGGLLSRPAYQYPSVFKGVALVERFPYCLPGLFSALLAVILAGIVAVFLQETLPPRQASGEANKAGKMSYRSIMSIPGVPIVILASAYITSQGFAFTAMAPLFEFTPTSQGGLSFEPQTISLFVAAGGLAQSMWMLLAYPPLQRRVGTLGVLRGATLFWPLFFFLDGPVANALRRTVSEPVFYAYFLVVSCVGSGIAMGFSAVTMACNHISPPAALGAINGLSASAMSLARVFAPGLANSAWAAGVNWGGLQGQLGWLVLIVWAALSIPLCRALPPNADSRPLVKEEQSAAEDA